mgnify:CR=1 FL=1
MAGGNQQGVASETLTRWGGPMLALSDPDGIRIELVEVAWE